MANNNNNLVVRGAKGVYISKQSLRVFLKDHSFLAILLLHIIKVKELYIFGNYCRIVLEFCFYLNL